MLVLRCGQHLKESEDEKKKVRVSTYRVLQSLRVVLSAFTNLDFYLKTSKTPCPVCHSEGSVFITTLGEVVITDTGLLVPLVPPSNVPFISACDVLSSYSIATTLS